MPKYNNDFLRFSAYSIKDLIVRKLSEDTAFSDQNFPASNLNILIDLVSYMYQVLLYNLNGAAAASMFADTQLYENMNRLCKFIGYSPMGAVPGHCTFNFPITEDNERKYIPKYSAVDTGLTGADGNHVFFSVGNLPIQVLKVTDKTQNVTLYNGVWKLLPQTFIYEGNDWEEITLDGLVSDASKDKFAGHQMVDVYAVKFAEDGSGAIESCELFTPAPMGLFRPPTTGNFFGNSTNAKRDLRKRIFTNNTSANDVTTSLKALANFGAEQNDRVFDLRLNEEKTYTVRFGDGVTGAKPPEGSVLYVMYFEAGADVPEGVTIGSVADALFRNDAGFFGMSEELYNRAIIDNNDPRYALDKDGRDLYALTNVTIPTKRKAEETVDEIRENAPNWFKLAGRLVTQADYEYYISTSPDFPGITKCKCQNNWEYISTFYKWLYETGVKKHNDGTYYLNQNNMSKMGWKVADAADGNNVYIWYKDDTGSVGANTSMSSNSRRLMMPLKDLTHEIVFQPAIQIDFAVAAFEPAKIVDEFRSRINAAEQEGDVEVNYGEGGWFNDRPDGSKTRYSMIEVAMDTANLYTSPVIKSNIAKIIFNYFQNSVIGQFINYNDILNEIYAIPGVRNVRTVQYTEIEGGAEIRNLNVFNGLSFMTCVHNISVMNVEDSLQVGNSGFQLEPFQSAKLAVDDYSVLLPQIQLISKSGTLLNAAQY